MRKTWVKKWMIKSSSLLIALICLVISETGVTAYAQTPGGFSIRAVIPNNQLDTKQTYFDLRMKPGEEQKLQIVINNSQPVELETEVRLNAASTGRNGLIVYTEPDVRDENLKVAITDVASLETQKVTVPPLGSETVTIELKMPEKPFDGVILGGIAVTGSNTGNGTQATEGVSLNNTITYVIGLKLTENENEVEPDFDLASITPSLINYRTAVVAALHNKAPLIVKDIDINAQVYRKGSNAVLHELILNGAEMAPLSKGDFVIDWGGETLKPGTYRLKMTAGYEGKTWEWDKEFTITSEANDLNKEALGIKKDYRWLYLLLSLAILVIISNIAYRMGKRRKNDKG